MTNEEAIKNIKEHCYFANLIPQAKEALDMAISALDLISHIKDRPCDACDYNKGNGCTRWECAFDEHLYGKEKK